MAFAKLQPENFAPQADEIISKLSIYDKAGIASRDRFAKAPVKYHPQNIMPEFQSIIAFAQGHANTSQKSDMGGFHNLFECIASQDAVINYLNERGYKAFLISATTTSVSLPRIGRQAGIGEISGVNSLVIEGQGLAASLGAIITDAPLAPNAPVNDVCTECWNCVEVCPATDKPFHMKPSRCTACGECIHACPV